jgi:DNA-binding HxlR family transcriptional regulator
LKVTLQPEPHPPIDDFAVNAVLIAVRQAADVICDRSSLVLLLFAHAGVERFGDFRERSALGNRQLISRLGTLIEQEILVRLAYSRHPPRYGYHLTHMGLDLFDVFATMVRWDNAWSPDGSAKGVLIEHVSCGASAVEPQLQCGLCAEEVTARSVVEIKASHKDVARVPPKATSYRRSSPSTAADPRERPHPLAHCFEIFGDKWSIEVLVSAFLRTRNFGDFQAQIGISTNILSDRLTRLVHLGILRLNTQKEAGRAGAYMLTEKGIALYPILLAIQAWADKWLRDRYRSPVRLKHRTCGQPLQLSLVCSSCGKALQRANARITVP